MSLQRIAPRLILSSCNNINRCNKTIINSSVYNSIRVPASAVRRGFSAPASTTKKDATKLTAEEVEAALEKANESMKAYYSYPPEKVIAAKKARFDRRHRDKQFYLQLGIASSLVCCFLITPFLGRKIAYDEEFRNKYIPDWYDFTTERPANAWTKEELNQEIIMLQRKLHERAIAGDFTPEKLEEMRRYLHKIPENPDHAHFAQLHPGVDADEDLED